MLIWIIASTCLHVGTNPPPKKYIEWDITDITLNFSSCRIKSAMQSLPHTPPEKCFEVQLVVTVSKAQRLAFDPRA
jgi:hypothetical protein